MIFKYNAIKNFINTFIGEETVKKIIFGKKVEILTSSNWSKELNDSVDLYSDCEYSTVDIIIQILDDPFLIDVLSNNPKIFKVSHSGFQVDFGSAIVSWELKELEPLYVKVFLRDPFKNNLNLIRKIMSMEYSTRTEWFVQILHELILIPTAHFFSDLTVIHAACIGTEKGCLLLTGTGGVGKSSALLAVANIDNISFISDDIVVIDKEGIVYGNMAWPKIYGYNCEGNLFESLILKDRSFIDRAHFYIKKRNNPASVRRKLKPNRIFKNCISTGVPIFGIYFLFKEVCENIAISKISKNKAVDATIHIMNSEYQVFYKFLEWLEYNCSLIKKNPLITMDKVKTNWKNNLNLSFNTVHKVSIPINIDHAIYQKNIREIITKNFN